MRNFLILILIGLSIFAGAQEKPRLIDFDQTLFALNGIALVDADTKQPLTLGVAVSNALNAPLPDDAKLNYHQKEQMGDLAKKVWHGGKIALTSGEIELIKPRLALVYNALVVSQSVHLLDPADK